MSLKVGRHRHLRHARCRGSSRFLRHDQVCFARVVDENFRVFVHHTHGLFLPLLGTSSVSQREDPPAFASQFDGMDTCFHFCLFSFWICCGLPPWLWVLSPAHNRWQRRYPITPSWHTSYSATASVEKIGINFIARRGRSRR